jgi:phenylacetate-CoA ligase
LKLAAALRDRRLSPALRAREAAYREGNDAASRRVIQLDLLNTEWRRILDASPYFAALSRDRGVPDRFRSLEEFEERLPVMTRAIVQQHGNEIVCRGKAPDSLRTTGGSTSEPVQIPSWRSERTFTDLDMWGGRSWYGVTPSSRLFLIWGHAHLLGTGWVRHFRNASRRLKDALLGYDRFPAYDLRPEALRAAVSALLIARPEYLIGYSVALDFLARANRDRRDALRGLRLKLVVGTAESFPTPESIDLLADLFGCPVGMEYGAVETGVMAHTHPDGGFRFFWRSYLCEALPRARGHALLVTSLYPRSFPLVRYDIGDEIEIPGAAGEHLSSIDWCERIHGRSNEFVLLPDGAIIHSEAFSHVFKPFSEIRGFQVVQAGDRLTIRIATPSELAGPTVAEIRARMRDIHPGLADATLERCDALQQTIAGKTRMVIRKPDAAR